MRLLLMLLLLANLGFLAWQGWYADRTIDPLPAGRPEPTTTPRLMLLEELEPEQPETVAQGEPPADAAAPAASGAEARQEPPLVCATLGPFEERDAAQVARERLAAAGLRAALRETGGQIRSGFWVYLPPFASREAAEDIQAELRAKGVHDLFIVSGSEQQNAISLGLFSTPERADQRAAEIGRLGYSPRVAERFRDATVYWVDFIESPGVVLEAETVGVLGVGRTLPERREISCGDVAVDEGGA